MPSILIKPEPPHAVREELSAVDALTQKLLFVRGITTHGAATHFFDRVYETGLHDPFLLNDMDKAVERILRAIDAREQIAIYSDYDCDGIPGGVLVHDFFVAIGYTHFENYIPHRHEEGYGVSEHAIETLAGHGVSLVITVDCGIGDCAAVAHAQSLGIDVIVTDHHEPGPELPPAVAVLNPKRADTTYPFSGLCGSGVAFKLVSALLVALKKRESFVWTPGKEKWLLDMVGIATIADMVPLTDENRLFAHYGLAVLRKGRRVGLAHLLRSMRMQAHTLTEDDVGFMIAPRINAASRMGIPHDAFRLLATQDEVEASGYARHLEQINNERKGVVGSMVKSAKHKLSLRSSIDPVLVLGDASWRPSLVGLAANTLAEEYHRPVFVWGRDGREILKGSCRAGDAVSVVDLMRGAHEVFHEYGGHHASGGFAIKEEYIHTFPARLNTIYAELTKGSADMHVEHAHEVDAELALYEVTPALVRTLTSFAPFGEGNAKPLFLVRHVVPTHVDIFGKQKAHTKIAIQMPRAALSAIGFFKLPEEFSHTPQVGQPCALIAHVEESTFLGRREIRLRVVDIVADAP